MFAGKGHGLGMVVKCIGCGLIWMMKVGHGGEFEWVIGFGGDGE